MDQGSSLRKQIGTWRFLSSLIREICIFFLPILGSDEVWLFDKFKEFGTLWVNSSFPDAEASLSLKPHHLRRTKHIKEKLLTWIAISAKNLGSTWKSTAVKINRFCQVAECIATKSLNSDSSTDNFWISS